MKKLFVLAALALAVVLSLYSSSQPIMAQSPVPTATAVHTNGDILLEDEASCLAMGGTWDGTVTTCTIHINWLLSDGDTLTISSFVTLFDPGGLQSNNGTITNNGTFTHSGTWILSSSGTINNHGTFINDGKIDNSGTINNCGTFTNYDTIYNNGTINNGGTFIINGSPNAELIGNPVNEVNDACDDTPPVISANVSGMLGDNGWYTSDVEVNWAVTDDESSIISTNGCETTLIDSDTAGTTLTCEASSDGGTNSASVAIQRDATAPTARANISPVANPNGWHNSDVTISFSGSDNLSGIANCDVGIILSSEGTGQSASGACTDNAGNVSATATASGINIDRTAPVVTVTGVEDGVTYILGAVPAAGCETSDALSGVDTETSLTVSGGNPNGTGSFTATCDGASDNASNTASASATYNVVYDLGGFTGPIDPQAVNEAKAGQTIPVKFSLNGDQGLAIFAEGYPVSQEVACAGSVPVNEVEETGTAGNSGLSYNPDSDTYTYVWKTKKDWSGACRQFILGLNDGSEHSALFRFK